MNKKILGIIAASTAVIGSAIIASPADAQTATLPVEITVRPAVFLRTYSGLKFQVSTQDLIGGGSLDQGGSAGNVYDEANTPAGTLVATPPVGTSTDTVFKEVKPLYQLWGGSSSANVKVTASVPTLKSAGTGGIGGGGDDVTMEVVEGGDLPAAMPTTGGPFLGNAKLSFKFLSPTSATAGKTYSGGELTISVVKP
jgi:hypothetical protein